MLWRLVAACGQSSHPASSPFSVFGSFRALLPMTCVSDGTDKAATCIYLLFGLPVVVVPSFALSPPECGHDCPRYSPKSFPSQSVSSHLTQAHSFIHLLDRFGKWRASGTVRPLTNEGKFLSERVMPPLWAAAPYGRTHSHTSLGHSS